MKSKGILVSGSPALGVTLVCLQATKGETAQEDPLRSFSATWLAPRRRNQEQRDDIQRIALYHEKEFITPERTAKRWEQAQEYLLSTQVILPVGGACLRLCCKLSGNARKMLGTTIREKDRWVIPLDSAKHGGPRALRDYFWTLVQAKFIRRAVDLAANRIDLRLPQPKVWGEGKSALQALRDLAERRTDVGVDLETAGIDPRYSPITAFGLADGKQAISVPWHQYNSAMYGFQPGLTNPEIGALVRRILADPLRRKIFHNGAFDLNVLRGHGIAVNGPVDDTILAHRVCFAGLYHNLQFCMAHFAPVDPWKTRFEVVRKNAGEPADDWSDCRPDALMSYNCDDAAAETPLWEWLAPRIDALPNGRDQYAILKELAVFSADVRWHGVRIDAGRVAELDLALEKRLAQLTAEWSKLTDGVPFRGPGSKKALHNLFFKTLRAPVLSRTKKNEPSLSSANLLDYDAPTQPDDKLADTAFLKFRISKASKARDAFITPLLGAERVHPELNFGGTKGTRANCINPNLQQWSKPKETNRPRTGAPVKLAPPLRLILRPDAGHVMWEFDANALELRLVAYAANIPIWLQWMRDDIDMHIQHVEQMFGVKVTKKPGGDPDHLRDITKTLTYARFYNDKASVEMVLRALKPKMPTLTEKRLIEVFRLFDLARPEVVGWQKERQAFIAEHGYVETGMGGWRQYHDRRFPDLNAAYSFSIQSTGGAFMNPGMLRVQKRLPAEEGSRILFQVHDALVGQSKPENLMRDMQIVKNTMEEPVTLWNHENVVIPFDGHCGMSWGEMTHSDPKKFLLERYGQAED